MAKFNKVTILGGGAFGVALAKLAADKSKEVVLWARDSNVCHSINHDRRHPTKLANIALPFNIMARTNLPASLYEADVVILALPMIALSSVLNDAKKFIHPNAIIVSTTKGIEEQSLALPCDVIKANLPKNIAERACFLSGPSFAMELAMDLPTALTLASKDQMASICFQEGFSRNNCRLYRTDDVVGVCVGGALKNVIAIAAGACTSLALGKNALAALITRGLSEIVRLAVSMGGRVKTLSGLSGAGDLILSCTDDMSRNHRLGMMLATGIELDVALNNIGSVVEGIKTAKAIPQLINKFGVELPISLTVYRVLYEGYSIEKAISFLLSRALKEEDL